MEGEIKGGVSTSETQEDSNYFRQYKVPEHYMQVETYFTIFNPVRLDVWKISTVNYSMLICPSNIS
jgi:hypothetical protein